MPRSLYFDLNKNINGNCTELNFGSLSQFRLFLDGTNPQYVLDDGDELYIFGKYKILTSVFSKIKIGVNKSISIRSYKKSSYGPAILQIDSSLANSVVDIFDIDSGVVGGNNRVDIHDIALLIPKIPALKLACLKIKMVILHQI
jgi:hypothetical protein